MPRLFTGIELPDEIRQKLARLKQPLPSTRWIEPANYHITLRFVGDIDHGVAREFAAELATISFDPFALTISGLSTFGGNDPRTIWAGLEKSEPLELLARACDRAARNAGLKPEGRKFAPHITLARLNTPRIHPIARYLQRAGSIKLDPFLVDHFQLFASKPNTGGGPYVVEETYPSTLGQLDADDIDDWTRYELDQGHG